MTTMRDEYDFSNAERGKFYRPDAQFNVPIYLEADVRELWVKSLASQYLYYLVEMPA